LTPESTCVSSLLTFARWNIDTYMQGSLIVGQLPQRQLERMLTARQLFNRICELPCDPGLRGIVRACLQYNPEARENAPTILKMIQELQRAPAPEGWRSQYDMHRHGTV
jgi:hypothetical protein